MKYVLILLVTFSTVPFSYSEVLNGPLGEKDGVELFIRVQNTPEDNRNMLICDLVNTTDKAVPFVYRGSLEGCGLIPHLYNKGGNEIPRSEQWRHSYEDGDSFHLRFGAVRPGVKFGPVFLDLDMAYGKYLSSGVKLIVEWKTGSETRRPGPFGGELGVGNGLSGTIDIASILGEGSADDEFVQEREAIVEKLSVGSERDSDSDYIDRHSQEGKPGVTTRYYARIFQILLIVGCVFFLLFWLILRIKRRRS